MSIIQEYAKYQGELSRLERELFKLSFCGEIEGEEKDEFLHSLIVSFKVESEKLLNDFQERHGSKMNDIDYFTSWVYLEKECIEKNDAFVANICPLMSYDLNDKQDPRNQIKRCPNLECRLVWIKTEGCDGATECGRRVEKLFFDTLRTGWHKFEFIRKDDGSFKWTKKAMVPIQKAEQKNSSQEKTKKGKGCGTEFEWGLLPCLEKELLLELFHAKTIEEVKERLTKKDFLKQKDRAEGKIDTRFYTSTIPEDDGPH